MDRLCNAYSNASDDEEEARPLKQPRPETNRMPHKPNNPFHHTNTHHPPPAATQFPVIPTETHVPGRYISKRERALLGSHPDPNFNPSTLPTTSSGIFLFEFLLLSYLLCEFKCSNLLCFFLHSLWKVETLLQFWEC